MVASQSSAETTPSATRRKASATRAICRRFSTKPSTSRLMVAGTMAARIISARVAATVASLVQEAGQISTTGIR